MQSQSAINSGICLLAPATDHLMASKNKRPRATTAGSLQQPHKKGKTREDIGRSGKGKKSYLEQFDESDNKCDIWKGACTSFSIYPGPLIAFSDEDSGKVYRKNDM
jgi:hypothetical protein